MWLLENSVAYMTHVVFHWVAGLEHEVSLALPYQLTVVPAVPLVRACPFDYYLKGSNYLFYSPLHIWSSLCPELCTVILLAHLSSDLREYSEWIICECTVWHHIDDAVDYKMSSNVRNGKENKCILEGDLQYSLTLDLFGVLSFFL